MNVNDLIALKECLTPEDIDKIAQAVVDKLNPPAADATTYPVATPPSDPEPVPSEEEPLIDGKMKCSRLYNDEVEYQECKEENELLVDKIVKESDSNVKFTIGNTTYTCIKENNKVKFSVVIEGQQLELDFNVKERGDSKYRFKIMKKTGSTK